MRCLNIVVISGNVSDSVVFSETGSGEPACSFCMASDKSVSTTRVITTWVRVNVYGTLVQACRKKLTKGMYVTVTGEMMNRSSDDRTLTEVRAKELIFGGNS